MEKLFGKIDVSERLNKAIEYKQGLIQLNIIEKDIPGLVEFSKLLNLWVKNNTPASGKIKLPEINKKLTYQLASVKNTYIKLSEN